MGYTVEELKQIRENESVDRVKLKEEIAKITDQMNQVNESMNAAAVAGNLTEFKKIKAERAKLEDLLSVKNAFQAATENDSKVTEQVVKDAWAEYVEKYNHGFDKVYAEYEKARKEAARKYYELAAMMKDALKVQFDCAQLVGENPRMGVTNIFKGCHKLDSMQLTSAKIKLPYSFVTFSDASIPILYYLNTGDLSNEQAIECCTAIDRGPFHEL